MSNPNFKPHMITDKLLEACEEQVQKYFGEREMDRGCLICMGLPASHNCAVCPLGDGGDYNAFCIKDSTFIEQDERSHSTKRQLLARGNRLIEILNEHGIEIYDAEVKK